VRGGVVRVAVIGATGVAGRHVVDELETRGHEVVSCSRATGQDVVTGAGLLAALEGVETVVDVSNVATVRRSTALAFFAPAARTLRSAAREAGVAHVVVLSIVGIERMRSLGYYDAKCTQERLALSGDVPATVVRATQFHELVGVVAERARLGPVAFVPSLRVQTVAARSVASVLVDAALGSPWRGTRPDVAGPGPVATMAELARTMLGRSGSRGVVVAVPLPPAASRPNRDGALLPAPDAAVVGPSFVEWLDGPDAPRPR
jgi:uncharacterized protein YbjT (DUF2867 family)